MLASRYLVKSFGPAMRSVLSTGTKHALSVLPVRLTSLRSASGGGGRKGCAGDGGNKSKKGKKKKEPAFKSMWENPACCKQNPCPDVTPRFDDLYYKVSDKAKRNYKQTWSECPDLKIVKKEICAYEKIHLPPREKRPRNYKPKAGCSMCKPAKCDDPKKTKK